MPATSTQSKLISYQRAKKPPPLDYPVVGSSLLISGVQGLAPSWLAKRPRTLQDRDLGVEPYCGWIQIRRWKKKCGDAPKRKVECVVDLSYAHQISIWGAKRARGAILLDGNALRNVSLQIPVLGAKLLMGDGYPCICTSQIPVWGAKRARSAHISAHISSEIPILLRDDNIPSGISDWRDWTALGDGPAGLIAECLLANDVADYVCFRAVCRAWRLCSTDPRAHGILDRRFHPRQWIMLRETGGSPYRRRFMNVFTGYSRYLELPELRGHDVFGPTTEGLLVLLDRTTCGVRLLNPLTRQMADLPPACTLITQEDLKRTAFMKDLLQVSGAGLADDRTIAVHFRRIGMLAVVKPGDGHWTVVERGIYIMPTLSFDGRFYCATTQAIMVVETSADEPPRLVIVAKLTRPFSRIMMDTVHFVDNDGELILVDRQCSGNGNRKYEVYQVDLGARKMVPARGFGGRAVFIGVELALSVSPSVFPSISANAIYLGFDGRMTGILDNSPIHLMDGTDEPRQFKDSIDGMPLFQPLGVDHYLSWCVTGYRDKLKDT